MNALHSETFHNAPLLLCERKQQSCFRVSWCQILLFHCLSNMTDFCIHLFIFPMGRGEKAEHRDRLLHYWIMRTQTIVSPNQHLWIFVSRDVKLWRKRILTWIWKAGQSIFIQVSAFAFSSPFFKNFFQRIFCSLFWRSLLPVTFLAPQKKNDRERERVRKRE